MLYSERQIKFVKDTEKVPLIFGCLENLHNTHTHTHTHTISATGVQYFNYASPRALMYGFAFGEPAHARQSASELALLSLTRSFLCRNVREACLFFRHLAETFYESAITYQYKK